MNISQVSEKYKLSQDTLRYYERIGLIPHIKRNSGGYREYSDFDCGWIEAIRFMRNAGMTIELLLEYVGMVNQGDDTKEARKNLLITQRSQLVEKIADLHDTLARLTHKIDSYETAVVPKEKMLIKN